MKRLLVLLILSSAALGLRAVAPWLSDSVDALVAQGLATKAFPGCQVYMSVGDSVVVDRAYGCIDYDSGVPVTPLTLYDLASVSKAAGTLPGIMAAYDDRLFELTDTIGRFLPELRGTPKASITMSDLLYHQSGMPAWLAAVKRMDRPDYDSVMSMIHHIPLRPDRGYCYSCLNFCLLMEIERRLTGMPHDEWLQSRVLDPLGIERLCYRPLERFSLSEIAPTELDTLFRHKLLHGEVHDEIGYMSGGVQGNAGLFATSRELAKLCRYWLDALTDTAALTDCRPISPSTVRLFASSRSHKSRRGLGFDRPDNDSPELSPTTALASPSTFGHLGFTGTCFWVDPERRLIYIFLCNRVNPSRDNKAFAALNIRPRLFELLYQSLNH